MSLRMPRLVMRFGLVAVTALTMITALVPRAAAAPLPSAPTSPGSIGIAGPASKVKAPHPTSGSGTVSAYAANPAQTTAVARINTYRRTYGASPIAWSDTYAQATTAHSNYCSLNGAGPGCTSWFNEAAGQYEDPTKPGFTALGDQYAQFMIRVQTADPVLAIETMMFYPAYRDQWLLDLASTSISMGSAPGWTSMIVEWNESAAAYPRTWPVGSTFDPLFRSLDLDPGDVSPIVKGCPAPQASKYGYPVSTQWNYGTYDAIASKSSGTLLMDGLAQSTCMVTNPLELMDGQAVMVPLKPLSNGAIYTGTMAATFPTSAGVQSVSKPFGFTTWAAATGVHGDQSGDGVADFVGINGSSNLYFHKMRPNGTVGANLLISSRFNTATWIGNVPDVNGDRRSDLLSRNTYGDIYIWYGNGMGSYTQGPKVGISWNSMNTIVGVGDLNGDGTPEMIARDNSGYLWRYTVFATKITNKTLIGSGWGSVQRMVGIGKYNADNRYDLVTTDTAGNLWMWPATTTGAFSTKVKIGTGWGGFTYLFSPGDIDKDGRWDLVARDSSGRLWTFFNTASGFKKVSAGTTNWTGYRAFA